MSDTPRADLDLHWIEAHGLRLNHKYVSYALAQALERELNEAKDIMKRVHEYNGFHGRETEKAMDDLEKYLEKGEE